MSKGAIIGLAAVVGVSYALGYAAHDDAAKPPPPKVVTRVVTVPTVKTHVETKEVYKPYPESCLKIPAVMAGVQANNDALTKNTGEVLDALSDLNVGTGQKDQKLINDATQRILTAQSNLGSAANTKSEQEQRLSDAMSRCREEIAAGP